MQRWVKISPSSGRSSPFGGKGQTLALSRQPRLFDTEVSASVPRPRGAAAPLVPEQAQATTADDQVPGAAFCKTFTMPVDK
jgi:hypothetical protein